MTITSVPTCDCLYVEMHSDHTASLQIAALTWILHLGSKVDRIEWLLIGALVSKDDDKKISALISL